MSAAPRKAQQPSARPKLVPTPRTYPLPEVFWSESDDDEARDLPEPITFIYVKRVGRTGEEDIATVSGDQLQHRDQVRETFGPGVYKLVGRGVKGKILARAVLTLGAPLAAPDTGMGAPTPATPIHVDPIVSSLLQSTNALAASLATSAKESNATIITAISQLAGSRLTDQKELFHTLLKDRGGGAKGELAAFMKGTEWIQKLLDEHGAGDDDEKPSELKEIMEAFKEFRNMRKVVGPDAG